MDTMGLNAGARRRWSLRHNWERGRRAGLRSTLMYDPDSRGHPSCRRVRAQAWRYVKVKGGPAGSVQERRGQPQPRGHQGWKDWEVKHYRGVKSGLEQQKHARLLLMIYSAAKEVLN